MANLGAHSFCHIEFGCTITVILFQCTLNIGSSKLAIGKHPPCPPRVSERPAPLLSLSSDWCVAPWFRPSSIWMCMQCVTLNVHYAATHYTLNISSSKLANLATLDCPWVRHRRRVCAWHHGSENDQFGWTLNSCIVTFQCPFNISSSRLTIDMPSCPLSRPLVFASPCDVPPWLRASPIWMHNQWNTISMYIEYWTFGSWYDLWFHFLLEKYNTIFVILL